MSYPNLRWCKHCLKSHPHNERFYFLRNGLLRKCKKFYKLYESARAKAKREGRAWTKEMYAEIERQVRQP